MQEETRAQHPVYYRITVSVRITKVKMKKLLSRANTKNKLTEYLMQTAVEYAE